MAEFPALPLWTDAYLGDTTHLSTIEHGAYLLLLMVAWRSRDCRLPNDDQLLARYARCTRGQWTRIKPVLEQFFDISDSHWMQRRLTDEYEAVRQRRESQAANGRASALKRHGRHSTEREPSVNQSSTPITIAISNKNKAAECGLGSGHDVRALAQELCKRTGIGNAGQASIGQVGHWLTDGISASTIRTIVGEMAAKGGSTRSLKRFDAPVRRAHAERKPNGSANGASYVPRTVDELERAITLADERGWAEMAAVHRATLAAMSRSPPKQRRI